jgi:hypothetical protein
MRRIVMMVMATVSMLHGVYRCRQHRLEWQKAEQ